jgi:hypothetical protein
MAIFGGHCHPEIELLLSLQEVIKFVYQWKLHGCTEFGKDSEKPFNLRCDDSYPKVWGRLKMSAFLVTRLYSFSAENAE